MYMAMHEGTTLLSTWNKQTTHSTALWVTYTPIQNADYGKRTLTLLPLGLGGLAAAPSLKLGRPGACGRTVLGLRGLEIGPPKVKLCLTHPKDSGAAGPEELWKDPWAWCLLAIGFPPPSSFLRVAPPMDDSTLHRVVFQELGCVQGLRLRKEDAHTQASRCFFWHIPL